jgi:DNA-binding NarL/FixJ family response regulator
LTATGTGQGLGNLRERAEGLGGRAEIQSAPGEGTRVRVRIPHLEPARWGCQDAAMTEPPLRVMLVDDHQVVRDGIKLLLSDTTDVVAGAEASSAREAVAVAAQALPDVIVMDVRLSDGSGIEATLAVGAGQNLLDPAVTKSVFDRLRKGKHLLKDEELARLSPQEERILPLVAEGGTNGQIAGELGLAEKTVKNYVSSILAKLEVARRAEAAAYLARHTTLPGSS